MSENQKPQVRSEEPELSDDALEQVAGGCHVDSHLHQDPWTQPVKPLLVDGFAS